MPEHPGSRRLDGIAIFVHLVVMQEKVQNWLNEKRIGVERNVYQCEMGILLLSQCYGDL